jgi:integrase
VASRPHKNYLQAVRYINQAVGHLEPRQLNETLVLAVFAPWKKKYAHNTLYNFAGVLRRLLVHLREHGAPKLEVPHVAGPRARPNIGTPEQIHQLVTTAAPWLRLFILLCWQTALRFSEAYRVSPRSYDKATRTISILTKGGKNRVLPVTSDIETLLGPTLEGDPDKSCIALLKGGRCSPGAVRSAWCKLTKRCGIAELNPHDLRRTTATNLYRGSKDIRAVQQYLGHDDMTSTLRYLAPLKEEQLRDYYKLLKFGKPN